MKKKLIALGLMVVTMAASSLPMLAEGYVIYPIPRQMTTGTGSLSLTPKILLSCETGIDESTRNRATSVLEAHGLQVITEAEETPCTTLRLGIVNSGEATDVLAFGELGLRKAGVMVSGKFDRHAINVSEQGITIIGEHTTAVFHALASLEQMLEQTTGDALEYLTIYDRADQQNRGLVEGYYGYPYSVEVKKDLMHHMMRYKMNTYLYGAKSDPYHSQMWKDEYPKTITAEQEKNGWLTQDMIKELSSESEATKVNFIWAIHPGNEFLGSNTAIADIMSKFEKMYGLGVRHFGVFVDDVGIPSSDADMKKNADRLAGLQQAIEEKWNANPASPADTVRPLHFVPQIYCNSFASSQDQRQRFMSALSKVPSYITVYSTGQGVWSVPNSEHTATIMSEFGRPMGWWWNYPCNDNADGQLYPMDMYSNFVDMPAVGNSSRLPSSLTNCQGLVANPMQQGEVAKTSLFSIADYAWNNSGFDNNASWEASFKALIKNEAWRQAYHDITYYLRWNDPEDLNTQINAYKASLESGNPNSSALLSSIVKIKNDSETVMLLQNSEEKSDRLLYTDIAPWLQTLHTYAVVTEKMLGILDRGEECRQENWLSVKEVCDSLHALEHSTLYTAYALEGMGNSISVSQRQAQLSRRYLLPFISYLRGKTVDVYFNDSTLITEPLPVTNSKLIEATVEKDGNSLNLSLPTSNLDVDKYVGIALPAATKVDKMVLADSLRTLLRYSADGHEWKSLADGAELPDGFVNYIILHNQTDKGIRNLTLSKGNFSITMAAKAEVAEVTIPSGNIYSGHGAEYVADGDYSTWTCLNRVQQAGDAYVLDLGKSTVLHDVRLCMGTMNEDYPTGARIQYSANGSRWSNLSVTGTTQTEWRRGLEQNVEYNGEAVYCDFDGNGKSARYVRLLVSTPNTEKWLRLYEIEVNGQYAKDAVLGQCRDSEGNSISALTDGDAFTGLSAEVGSSLTYSFNRLQNVAAVSFYSKPSSVQPVVSVTNDGEQWTSLGTLTEACQRVDLKEYPKARAVRLEWSGSVAPSIYEITAEYDRNSSSLPTLGSDLMEEYALLKSRSLHALDSCGLGNKLITSNRQFSSPYTETTEGSLNNLLDGNLNTFWHSAWSAGSVADGIHYLEISLPEGTVGDVSMHFGRRGGNTGHHLIKATILGVLSGSGSAAKTETVAELDMPYKAQGETVKNIFTLPKEYKAIRLREEQTTGATDAGSSGFFHVAELQLYAITKYWIMRDAEAEAKALLAATQPMPSEATEEDLAALKSAYDAFMYKVFDVVGDGISEVQGSFSQSGVMYDLSGRRVLTSVSGGVYIMDGRKVVIQ